MLTINIIVQPWESNLKDGFLKALNVYIFVCIYSQ